METFSYHTYIQAPVHQMSDVLLPEDVYAQAMNSLVIVTVDIAIYDVSRKTLWLAKRRVQPTPDWWIIGGRLFAYEREQAGVVRTFARETKLQVAPGRFRFIGFNRYFQSKRQQLPQSRGCDCLAYTFAIELTPVERTEVTQNLDSREYDVQFGLREFNRQALQALAQTEDEPLAALCHLYDDIFE